MERITVEVEEVGMAGELIVDQAIRKNIKAGCYRG
jgi:hypothetical protein